MLKLSLDLARETVFRLMFSLSRMGMAAPTWWIRDGILQSASGCWAVPPFLLSVNVHLTPQILSLMIIRESKWKQKQQSSSLSILFVLVKFHFLVALRLPQSSVTRSVPGLLY